jgi:hypothetical protein
VTTTYLRRISREEAETGRFMVLKSALAFFPTVGETFVVSDGETVRETAVEAVPCTCRGPEKPHEHYFVPWPGLTRGAAIEVAPDLEPGRYVLTTRE